MILAVISNLDFIPHSGFWNSLFHETWISLSIFGTPSGGYKLTLIGLVIIVLIALLAAAISERLTTKKPGGLAMAVLITLIGSLLAAAVLRLPWDFALEGVHILAALAGAVLVAVFYTLIRSASAPAKKA
ncbi:MAG TPA: hypothetical protein VFU63_11875 [Ktedonobacterales bacterium]|nr:hypothetical protein [Ktedonobacterales bacterium]